MWVFDGEEWTQDDGGEQSKPKGEAPRPRYDEMMPELQVVEIVPVPAPQIHREIPMPLPK